MDEGFSRQVMFDPDRLDPERHPHTAGALQYIYDVLDGTIPVCKWTKAAAQRQLDDIERQRDSDFPYVFNPTLGDKWCRFVELMPHVKGEWASRGETIRLHPSQQFRISTVFGWVHKDTGLRRFSRVYTEEARKNAKSTETAAIANGMLTIDGEEGAEVYSAATTRDQAGMIFKVARSQARKSVEFRAHFGVQVQAHALCVNNTDSFFHALSADGHTLDGLNPHFAAVDELHAHKTRDVYDVLETAMGARSQPILWAITTAGFDRSGICFELRSYLTMVLNATLHKHPGLGYRVEGKSVEDQSFWGIIYTIDDEDDWTDETCWIKANPLLDVSVKLEDIRRLARKAMEMPSAVNNFLTKRLNVWVNADTSWMDMRAWAACADHGLVIDDFAGEECIMGIDASTRLDVASICKMFRRTIDGEDHYYAFWKHYLPEETVEASSNAQYSGWARQGLFTLTDGRIINYDYIEEDIDDDASLVRIRELAVDPHQTTQLMSHMIDRGFVVVEVRPLVLNFSEPMKELEALVLDGRFHHNGDQVASWMVSNVVCHRDRKDNIYPVKETDKNKIDGVVACIMALNRWMATLPDADFEVVAF